MTQVETVLDDLAPVLSHDYTEETQGALNYNGSISEVGQDLLSSIIRLSDTYTDYFPHLRVSIEYDSMRAPTHLIVSEHRGLKASSHKEEEVIEGGLPSWLLGFRKTTSFYLDEEQYSEISSALFKRVDESDHDLVLDFRIDKAAISGDLKELVADSDCKISFWTTPSALQSWMTERSITEVAEKLFPRSSLPIFTFSQAEETEPHRGPIPLVNVDEIQEEDLNLSVRQSKYSSWMQRDHDIAEQTTDSSIVSPEVLSTDTLQNIFSDLFLHGSLSVISDRVEETNSTLDCTIESSVGKLTESLTFSEYRTSCQWKAGLYDFYSEFIQRGEREIYRDFWHRAIVEHCANISDIPNSKENVIHYYRSLEQKAISGNFDDLSGAVQDAQIFISDVTNTLSNSTVGLTTEVQKVVLALFGAIATNVFLLLRGPTASTAASFTIAFSAALLLTYFPTAQERIDELEQIINEGKKDTDIYSRMVSNLGASEFFDVSKFEKRQQAYIDLARNRVDWANRKLEGAFIVVSIAWAVAVAGSILLYPVTSTQVIIALASLPIAGLISLRHKDQEYFRKSVIGFFRLEPSPTSLIIIVALLAMGIKYSLL